MCGNVGNPIHYLDENTSKYKELELVYTIQRLEKLISDEKLVNKLINKLKNEGAVISAIHHPESVFNTCNEWCGEPSGNYLSICEVILDKKSKIFLHLLALSNILGCEQLDKTIYFFQNYQNWFKIQLI